MDLKTLPSPDLLKLTKQKSHEEQKLTIEVISLIREVDARRLYLELGYDSLFAYVKRELNYDESSAWRRVDASRILRQIPEVKEKISSGALSISNIVHAQKFFRKEEKLKKSKLSPNQKRNILEKLEFKSSREAQKTLAQISPEQVSAKESERIISEDLTEIKIVIHESLRGKLQKLKMLLSHQGHLSNSELLERLADLALKKLDPEAVKKPSCKKKPVPTKNDAPLLATSQVNSNFKLPVLSQGIEPTKTRYIPASIKQAVWRRDRGECTFIDPLTQRRCNSQFKLEIHHQIPFAGGGETSIQNLKLYCKLHNTFQAVRDFGLTKMQKFIPSLEE